MVLLAKILIFYKINGNYINSILIDSIDSLELCSEFFRLNKILDVTYYTFGF